MTQKALTKMKMMTKVCIGICLAANVMIVPIMWMDKHNPESTVSSLWYILLYFFKMPFVAMILAIVLSFGAMLGEPFFKMITPQEHYIKRAKINLLLSEFFYCLIFGIVPYAVILFVFF